MTQLLADLRYGFRSLRNTPLFTTVAVASIALAIGANTAVFTLVDQVILRFAPVQDPTRLVQVTANPIFGPGSGDGTELSYPMYTDLRDDNPVFSAMFCRLPVSLHVGVSGRTDRIAGELVSGSYFPVLGVQPALGRVLTEGDDRVPLGHPVAMLSYTYWQTRFASNPRIVGQTLRVNGQPLTIVGVAARGFDGFDRGQPSQVFIPFSMQPSLTERWLKMDDRRFRWIQVFGRMKDGLTEDQAEAGLQGRFKSIIDKEVQEAAFARASAEDKTRFLAMRAELRPASHGHSGLREYLTAPLWIMMAIAGGVLLIACANVANLLIARGIGRQREIALRLALGASRGRVIRQLSTEGFVLAALGGLFGLLVATWGASLLLAFYTTADNPLPISPSPDLRIIGFTFVVVVVTTVLCALAPAFQSTRPALAPTLKEGAGSVLGGGRVGLRKALVVSQVALSLLLLIGAGLFVRSLTRLLAVDPGFRVEQVVSFSVDFERSGYDVGRAKQFSKTLLARLQTLPGVTDASSVAFGLLEGGGWGMGVTVEGRAQPAGAGMNAVSPGFFRTLGVPLVAGRDFTPQDELTTRVEGWPYRVAIANESFVRRYLDGRNPLGVHVGLERDPGSPTPIEIVGVVKDTKYANIRDEMGPQLFVPYLEANDIGNLTTYIRTTRDPGETLATVRRLVQQADTSLPIYNVVTLEQQVAASVTNERVIATLSALFASLATLLAVVGLYGVMAYTVMRRTREIGIRIALGAMGRDVAWRVLREASTLIVPGLVLGLAAALWLTRYVESQLYGVTPGDPWTIVSCALVLIVVAAIAALIPARRAAAINPIAALRTE